jgi:hypothetical protein
VLKRNFSLATLNQFAALMLLLMARSSHQLNKERAHLSSFGITLQLSASSHYLYTTTSLNIQNLSNTVQLNASASHQMVNSLQWPLVENKKSVNQLTTPSKS